MFKELYSQNVLVSDVDNQAVLLQNLWEEIVENECDVEFYHNNTKFIVEIEESICGVDASYDLILKVITDSSIEFFKVNGTYSSYDGTDFDDYTPIKVDLKRVLVDRWVEV